MSMRVAPFGADGPNVSVIGQGTWYFERAPAAEAIAALRSGLDLGMTHIDTAEMYGAGQAETLVGRALEGRRDEAFVVSKVLPSNASRAGTIKACEASLKRLNTDRIECYLLHWRGQYPLADTIAAFEALKADGKILSWGVSNFDVEDMEELWATPGGRGAVCNQVLYHLEERAIEHGVIPWCEANGVAITAYSPFGHDGFPKLSSARGKVLAEIAVAHKASPRQIALAFLTRRPSVFAIPKAATRAHIDENAAAAAIVLTPHDITRLDGAFPLGPRPRSLPMI
jgi:diketogulonate reductase-like aldo/keto reductase